VDKALVTAREKSGGDILCAYVAVSNTDTEAPDNNALAQQLTDYLGRRLPDYMIPSYIVPVKQFPLTPSGKVDIRRLPEPETVVLSAGYTAPVDGVEEKLVEIWAEVLNMDRSVIGRDANFFRLGGHSLNATTMIDRVNKTFNLKILLMDVFRFQTIRELAACTRKAGQEGPDAITAADSREYYPLSEPQRWMYDQHIIHGPGNRAFNMPWLGELKNPEDLDRETAESIFKQLVKRHDGLRTSFHLVEGEPVQRIHETVPFEVEWHEQGTLPRETFMRAFVRPFDLNKAPLLRVGLLKAPDGTLLLMMDMHHIISDGESFAALFREFEALREGRALPRLTVRYVDYVLWEAADKRKKALKKQEEYWLDFFEKGLPAINLPTDHPAQGSQTLKSAILQFELDVETTTALKQLARNENSTLYMLMLALYNVLLFKLTGEEELVITSYIAARRHAELQRVVGIFVNTLMLRFFPTGAKPFKNFLEEVRKETLRAYENQEFRLDMLEDEFTSMESESEKGDESTPASPRVHFVFQNLNMAESEMAPFRSESIKYKEMISYYELFFDGYELGGRLVFNVEYATEVFEEERVRSFIKDYRAIIDSVLADPSWCLSEIAAL
jgi:acyl carrier protein